MAISIKQWKQTLSENPSLQDMFNATGMNKTDQCAYFDELRATQDMSFHDYFQYTTSAGSYLGAGAILSAIVNPPLINDYPALFFGSIAVSAVIAQYYFKHDKRGLTDVQKSWRPRHQKALDTLNKVAEDWSLERNARQFAEKPLMPRP